MTVPSNAIESIKHYLLTLQQTICHTLESIEQRTIFIRDNWTRSAGGGGLSCVLEQGDVFSKAGVNFSHVYGDNLPGAATKLRSHLDDSTFEALGVSLVFHPVNPFVPTTHFNVRFFMTQKPGEKPVWWFGGGFDLTPYYGFEEDCIHWHQTALNACQPFGHGLYERLKEWCDDYFYLPHRQEARGIGGIFFDDFQEGGFEHSFQFMQSIGNHFLKAYIPIVLRRKDMMYGERELDFQRYRRGRYVEFNLIYDRGTLFGLQSGGRTESILMSLPDVVHWRYDWHPEAGSQEEKLYTEYLAKRNWLESVI